MKLLIKPHIWDTVIGLLDCLYHNLIVAKQIITFTVGVMTQVTYIMPRYGTYAAQ